MRYSINYSKRSQVSRLSIALSPAEVTKFGRTFSNVLRADIEVLYPAGAGMDCTVIIRPNPQGRYGGSRDKRTGEHVYQVTLSEVLETTRRQELRHVLWDSTSIRAHFTYTPSGGKTPKTLRRAPSNISSEASIRETVHRLNRLLAREKGYRVVLGNSPEARILIQKVELTIKETFS